MIEILAKKVATGNLFVSRAQQLMDNHEWGLAYKALEEGFSKGGLSNLKEANHLLQNVRKRLGIIVKQPTISSENTPPL